MYYCDTFITQFEAGGKIWAGTDIIAKSWDEAQKFIDDNGFNHLTIVGKLYFRFKNYEFN